MLSPFLATDAVIFNTKLGPFLNRLACERQCVCPSAFSVTLSHLSSSSEQRHSALKVVKSACRYTETAKDEIKLLRKVSSANPSHPGREFLVSFLDSFQQPGPEDPHVCIVFEPLGENLLTLIDRNKNKGVPRGVVKSIAKQVLLGLQYLHEECDLVHTDIKPENISKITVPSAFFTGINYLHCSDFYSRCRELHSE